MITRCWRRTRCTDVQQPVHPFRVVPRDLEQDDHRPLQALEPADRLAQDDVGGRLGDIVGGKAQQATVVPDGGVPQDLVAVSALLPDGRMLEPEAADDRDRAGRHALRLDESMEHLAQLLDGLALDVGRDHLDRAAVLTTRDR